MSIREPRLAVLGAGHTGPVLARVLVEAGYPVSIAASGDPDRIALLVKILAPGAEPKWAEAAAADADIVLLAIPLHRLRDVPPGILAGKIVVDTMNYWPPTDGVLPSFENTELGSSELVQHRLPASVIVKSLNHIGYHELDTERRPSGDPNRRALGVAADKPWALDAVAVLLDRVGYDAVRLPSLEAGRVLQPGGPLFDASLRRDEFEREVSACP